MFEIIYCYNDHILYVLVEIGFCPLWPKALWQEVMKYLEQDPKEAQLKKDMTS